MNVIRAGTLGFCMGVRRAVDIAQTESEKTKSIVYTLGPLIHNAFVLDNLKKSGVISIEKDKIDTIPKNSTVIIRAHGVSPALEMELKNYETNIIDATCPKVKKSQSIAKEYAEKGYSIFLAGDKNHSEIIGIRGYAEAAGATNCFIVGNSSEAKSAAEELFSKNRTAQTVLIGQTTIIPFEYRVLGLEIKKVFPDLEIRDSICSATVDRQNALKDLCNIVQAIVITGDKNSANTRSLFELSCNLGKPSWLVGSPDDISEDIKNYKTVGLSAGASAPESLIADIERALLAL